MNTLFRAATLSLSLSASLLIGCGDASEEADLDLESLPVVTADDEKSDNPSAPSFFWVRPSGGEIHCLAAPCPRAEVRHVNMSDTQFIYKFDWRGLRLTPQQKADAEAQASSMLIYGKYTSGTAFGKPVKVLQVTRANLAASDASNDNVGSDSYYSVKESSTPCMGGSCPTLLVTMLGNGIVGPLQLQSADLSRLSPDPTFQSTLTGEFKAGTAYISITGIKDSVASVSQAFRPLSAPPIKRP
jgi:hypothetical protein